MKVIGEMYKLVDKIPVPIPNRSDFPPVRERHVKSEVIKEFVISTVFICIDHQFHEDGPPLLFETMIFPLGDFTSIFCQRCSTWDQALEMHERARKWLMEQVIEPKEKEISNAER
jgi:hypothetical protein